MKSINILIIDIDIVWVNTLEDGLILSKDIQVESVIHAGSIERAIATLQREQIDLVITDAEIKSTKKEGKLVDPVKLLVDFREAREHENFKIIMNHVGMKDIDSKHLDFIFVRPFRPERMREEILNLFSEGEPA